MNIPNFNSSQVVDEDGHFTSIWQQIFTQLFTELQKNVSNEGVKIPQQDAATITKLDNEFSTGALIYDNENHKLKVNIDGTFKEVQTS